MWFLIAFLPVLFWSLTNLTDSVIMRRTHLHPLVINTLQSVFMVLYILLFSRFVDVQTDYMWLLLGIGVFTICASVFYLHTMRVIDSSVINVAWALQNVMLIALGVFVLGEELSAMQFVGCVVVIFGILLLSFWHFKGNLMKTLTVLTVNAVLFLPMVFVQKLLVDNGEHVYAAMFWTLLGRDGFSIVLGLVLLALGKIHFPREHRHPSLFFLCAFAIGNGFCGWLTLQFAYQYVSLSVVSTIGNMQPFFMMAGAWMFIKLIPDFAPRELLTAQSVQIKLISFFVVFVGLTLLVI